LQQLLHLQLQRLPQPGLAEARQTNSTSSNSSSLVNCSSMQWMRQPQTMTQAIYGSSGTKQQQQQLMVQNLQQDIPPAGALVPRQGQ
jgi:hypothetical protein